MAKEKGKEKKKGKKKKTKQKEKEKEVKIEEDEPQEAVAEPEQLSKVHTLFNRYCQNGNRIILVSLSTNLIMLIFHSTYKILYQDDESPLSLDTEALPMNNDMQTNSIPRMASNCNNLITGLKTIIKSFSSFVGVFILLAIYIVGGIYQVINKSIIYEQIVLSFLNLPVVFDKP